MSCSSAPTLNEHITYPSAPEPSTDALTAPSQPRELLKDRLFVGNLHPSVDEYALLQIFTKYGRVTKLDFLFHNTGALKGKPRGYAFVEYASADEAARALESVNTKLLRGRKLVVTYAQQAQMDLSMEGSTSKGRPLRNDTRPTTLSLIKGRGQMRHGHDGTKNKIAMMEAKLRQMEKSKGFPSASSSLPPRPLPHPSSSVISGPSTSLPLRSSSHPSTASLAPNTRTGQRAGTIPSPLMTSAAHQTGLHEGQTLRGQKKVDLVGVKIKKRKEKEKSHILASNGVSNDVEGGDGESEVAVDSILRDPLAK